MISTTLNNLRPSRFETATLVPLNHFVTFLSTVPVLVLASVISVYRKVNLSAVAQLVERPSKGLWSRWNSTDVGQERDLSSPSLTPRHKVVGNFVEKNPSLWAKAEISARYGGKSVSLFSP